MCSFKGIYCTSDTPPGVGTTGMHTFTKNLYINLKFYLSEERKSRGDDICIQAHIYTYMYMKYVNILSCR